MIARTLNLTDFTFISSFQSDTEVQKFGSSSLLLYALALYLRAEDIDELAAEALTGGSNDKKVDFCYLDVTEGRAIVGQATLVRIGVSLRHLPTRQVILTPPWLGF